MACLAVGWCFEKEDFRIIVIYHYEFIEIATDTWNIKSVVEKYLNVLNFLKCIFETKLPINYIRMWSIGTFSKPDNQSQHYLLGSVNYVC